MKWSVRYYLEGDNNKAQQARIWKDNLTKEESEKEVVLCYNHHKDSSIVWAVSEWAELGKQLRRCDYGWLGGIPFLKGFR